MSAAAKRKTVAKQREHVAEQHPTIALVPDKAAPTHPKQGQETCTATRWLNGQHVVCELAAMHPGDHNQSGRGWRRRSGDDD